jgi:glycosyltransferase involved in cell wall biosynthesis
MSVLEAMAAARPIVATAVGGVPELLETADCGWLSRPADPADLARAMRQALGAGDLPARGARARASAIANYSAARMGACYHELFLSLMDKRPQSKSNAH